MLRFFLRFLKAVIIGGGLLAILALLIHHGGR